MRNERPAWIPEQSERATELVDRSLSIVHNFLRAVYPPFRSSPCEFFRPDEVVLGPVQHMHTVLNTAFHETPGRFKIFPDEHTIFYRSGSTKMLLGAEEDYVLAREPNATVQSILDVLLAERILCITVNHLSRPRLAQKLPQAFRDALLDRYSEFLALKKQEYAAPQVPVYPQAMFAGKKGEEIIQVLAELKRQGNWMSAPRYRRLQREMSEPIEPHADLMVFAGARVLLCSHTDGSFTPYATIGQEFDSLVCKHVLEPSLKRRLRATYLVDAERLGYHRLLQEVFGRIRSATDEPGGKWTRSVLEKLGFRADSVCGDYSLYRGYFESFIAEKIAQVIERGKPLTVATYIAPPYEVHAFQ